MKILSPPASGAFRPSPDAASGAAPRRHHGGETPSGAIVPAASARLPVASPAAGRELVESGEPVSVGADNPYGVDIRDMSPRQMADLSLELYMDGVLAYDEYSLLAFQPELHPDYDETVGALTGEPARPDEPRDFIKHWRNRLAFELRHGGADEARVAKTRRIVQVLDMIDRPLSTSA